MLVVGANSIAMYLMAQLMKGWISKTLKIHLGQQLFSSPSGPFYESVLVLLVLWLICFWMYRRRIFFKI